jgi:hypothetical protein
VRVLIKVGVDVLVGVNVCVAVDEGRRVQVGRGVRVTVLVLEGVRLGAEVMVTKTGVTVGATEVGVLVTNRIKTVMNTSNARPKKSNTGTRIGDGFEGPALIELTYSTEARNSARTISTCEGLKSSRGGFTFQASKPCKCASTIFIRGGKGV